MKNPLFSYIVHNHFLTTVLIVALAVFLLEIKGILVTVFISYILMAALFPWVNQLRKRGLANSIAVVIVYFVTLAFLLLLIFPLVPFFIEQIQGLINSFPSLVDKSSRIIGIQIDASQVNSFIKSELGEIGKNAITVTTKVFSGIFSALSILVISFYMLLDHDKIKESLIDIFPKNSHKRVFNLFFQVEQKLGAWLRGQIVLSVFIGAITWVALTILGLDFALPLALIAGILEIAPTIGPIISAVPAVIVALTISPTMAIMVAAVYTAIQMVENNILVPRIMEKAVGLNPIVIIIGVIIGGNLMGIAGALLSIPFISMLTVFYRNLQEGY